MARRADSFFALALARLFRATIIHQHRDRNLTLPASSSPSPVDSAASPEELDLLRRLRLREEESFNDLVAIHGPRMLAVIRRFLPQEHDSLDALQEAFIAAYKAIDRFQGEASLGTWLHRIAVNSALTRIRQSKQRKEQSIDDFLPRFLADGHRANPGKAWAIADDDTIALNENSELVRECIKKLPESYRAVLLLRDIEQRSTEETAEIMELSVANVKVRLHRARQALRELLDQYFGRQA